MKAHRYSWISAVLLTVSACSSTSTPSGSDDADGTQGTGSPSTGSTNSGNTGTGTPGTGSQKPLDGGGPAKPAATKDAAPAPTSGDAGHGATTSEPGPASIDGGVPAVVADGSTASDSGRVVVTDAGGGDAVADAATPPGDSAFQTCTSALKACAFDDKQTACSSVTTAEIPLTAGGTWGKIKIPAGPYGFFVEWNQGKAFSNPVSASEDQCDVIARLFGEPEATTVDSLNLRGADLSLYTVFRPACMKDGETYPVITWGNGTCGQTGGYAPLLATLASHGFVVFASNSRFTQGGNNEMLRALDFAKAANADSTSTLFKRLDLSKVGAMGHSQGAGATADAASDARIKAIILWNGGSSGNPKKPFLAVSGDRDIGSPTVAGYTSYVNAATQPGAWLFYHKVLETGGSATGHLTLMEQPERTTDVTVAWWKYILNGDAQAKTNFIGTDCGLCNSKADFEYGQHNLK